MKYSISAKQNIYIWIFIELLIYHLIGLRSNRIYYPFIADQSYEDLIRNISNPVQSFCDHMHVFDRQTIDTPNQNFIIIKFILHIFQISNYRSNILQYYHLYDIFVV